jgi:hypothetical protein
MQKRSGDSESPWNIPLFILISLACSSSWFVFSWSLVLHFSIDDLQKLIILLFTPNSSIYYYYNFMVSTSAGSCSNTVCKDVDVFNEYWSRSRWCNVYRACHWTQGVEGSNSAASDGFLRAIQIRSTTSFGGEVKPSVPCHIILRYVEDPLSIIQIMIDKTQRPCLAQFLPSSLLGVSAATRTEKSGGWFEIIRTQMGAQKTRKLLQLHWTLCAIPPLNSNH